MIIYNMKTRESHTQPLLEKQDSETNEGYDSDTSEVSSTTSEDSSLEGDLIHIDPKLLGISIEEIPIDKSESEISSEESEDLKEVSMSIEVRDLLGEDLTHKEKDDYVSMFAKFPKVFATKYTQLQGAKGVEHRIILKEGAKAKV